jgi:hypothetical protein
VWKSGESLAARSLNVLAKWKARVGWMLIKKAVLHVLSRSPEKSSTASEIGRLLDLHESARGMHHGYVVWTALGHLMAEGSVEYDESSKLYRLIGKTE